MRGALASRRLPTRLGLVPNWSKARVSVATAAASLALNHAGQAAVMPGWSPVAYSARCRFR